LQYKVFIKDFLLCLRFGSDKVHFKLFIFAPGNPISGEMVPLERDRRRGECGLILLERWQSGRMRRSRKPLSCNRGTGGSNPPLSAKTNYSLSAAGGFLFLVLSKRSLRKRQKQKDHTSATSKGVIWNCMVLYRGS
jgi:hypothetical protein